VEAYHVQTGSTKPLVTCDLPIRIVIVDDLGYVRKSLRFALKLEPSLKVLAEADNGPEAVALVEKHRSDVVLMDISMPVMNGIEATRIITSKFPDTKAIVLMT
jgi:DNA-binding NarL/FixJ family response regulator